MKCAHLATGMELKLFKLGNLEYSHRSKKEALQPYFAIS